MKKLKLLAALLALTVGLAGCGAGTASTPDSTPSSKPKKMLDGDNMIASSSAKQEYTEPEDVTYMRLLAGEDEYRACVLYLGGSYEITTDVQQVLDSQQGLRELWGFVYDIPEDHWVTSPEGGCDLYCIFPQEAQATLFVYETSLTDDAENPLQRGKQLYYSEDGQPICAETCPRNPAMEQVLQRFTSQVDEKYSHIVGRFRRELTHPERTQETELGNLFADIFTRSLGIDVMLIGSGSIRAEKLGPIVTYGDLIEGFPYDDGVYMFKVTGRQLRQMLHYMLREEAYTGHTEFYQLPSTLRLRYDRAKGDFDYFTYCGKEVGKEISDDALFTVGLQNYHFKNIESFFNISYDTLCKLQKPRSVATSCQDILMEYFREHEMLDAVVDGRMTILPPAAGEGD